MGNRLHVCKKYEVAYGSVENFNWQSEEFHDFLRAIGIIICCLDRTSDPCPWDFEIDKADWKDGINKLKGFSNLPDDEKEDVQATLDELETTVPEMIEIMEAYENEADPNWDYLEFSFF